MTNIFLFLSNSIEGNLVIALIGSLLWGIASIVFSPCHLSAIPLIIGYVSKERNQSSPTKISILFSLGMLVTVALIGVITGLTGNILGDTGRFGDIFMLIFFIIFGILLLDIIPIPDIKLFNISGGKRYSGNAFILGLLMGVGLGPCTFAFMAPMLGIVFQTSSSDLFKGIVMLLMFAIGHTAVLAFAGVSYKKVSQYLNWSSKAGRMLLIRRICGIVVIVFGIYNYIK